MRTESFVLRCQAIIMMTDDMVVGMGKSEDVEESLHQCSFVRPPSHRDCVDKAILTYDTAYVIL
jgi:hypothetical protein